MPLIIIVTLQCASLALVGVLWWVTERKYADVCELHIDLVSQVELRNSNQLAALKVLSEAVDLMDTIIADFSAGCDRMDAEVSELSDLVSEIVVLCDEESKAVGIRISEIAGEQEKMRRKAARPGAPNSAFEAIRSVAEKNSVGRDPEHDKLVALAEGS